MHDLEVARCSTSDAPPAQFFDPSGSTIPQRRYQSQTSKKPAGTTTITFAMESGDGFSIRNALNRKYTGLVDRDDEILAFQGSSSISIRIEVCISRVGRFPLYWPGSSGQVMDHGIVRHVVARCCHSKNKTWRVISKVRTRDWCKDPQPITRSKLGTEIAKSLKLFINVRLLIIIIIMSLDHRLRCYT